MIRWWAALFATSTSVALVIAFANEDGATARGQANAPPGTPSVSLLAAVARATIECSEFEALAGGSSPTAIGQNVFRDPFDATIGEWMEGRSVRNATKKPIRSLVVDPVEKRRLLLLPEGTGGLHRVFPVEATDPLVVAVRVRAFAKDGERPKLEVIPLEKLPEESEGPRSLQHHLGRDRKSRPEGAAATRTAQARPGDEWQTLAVPLAATAERRGVLVSILEGSGAVLDEFSIRKPTPCEQLGATRQRDLADPAQGGHPLVRTVRAGQVDSRVLLLPVGSRVRYELELSAKAPRLDASAALHPFAPARSALVSLRIDGAEIAVREIEAPCPKLEPWIVPLDRYAGRRVALEIVADGDSGGIAILGDPWVLSGTARRPGPNLVLISLDTLRRDALGCYGNENVRTPAIDSLASAGTCFTRATSPVSFTLPAHASLFTGQHPIVHGATEFGRAIDPQRSHLLAERLAEKGWQNAAFTGGVLVHPDFGFGRGFGTYSFDEPSGVDVMFQERTAPLTKDKSRFAGTTPALEWLARRTDQPFFLFLHTYFGHNYVPSAEFTERHGARYLPGLLRGPDGKFTRDVHSRWNELEQEPGTTEELRKLYAATVEELDARYVAPLLQELDRLGLADDTIVVVLSDHGEGFREHGELHHGRSIWSEMVGVPLIFRGPGIPRGERRDDLARLEDVSATLSRLLGLAPDEHDFGRDLLAPPPEEDAEPVPRLLHIANPAVQRTFRWDGLVFGRYTLLREHLDDGEYRELLFDTRDDPLEQHDLAGSRPDLRTALARRLDAELLALMDRASTLPGGSAELTGERDELEKRLQELGYSVGGKGK